jgi:hypothetical protein
MNLRLDDLSGTQKYYLLRKVVECATTRFGNADDETYAFQSGRGRVNLVGARGFTKGIAVDSGNTRLDDTMFVVYHDGDEGHVHSFRLSTEYGRGMGRSYLIVGQHLYRLHYHHEARTDHLHLAEADTYQRARYRALEPPYSLGGVRTFLDDNHNLRRDESEVDNTDPAINIHYGENPGWSAGCQVIGGWDDYKHFIRLVEQDHSIVGTINNELASAPAVDGTRYVVYTLVEGSYLEEIYRRHFVRYLPVRISGSGPGPQAVTSETAALAATRVERLMRGGTFPFGQNRTWHGGIHFECPDGAPVVAPLPGRVVAARLGPGPPADTPYGSSRFILCRHDLPALLRPALGEAAQAFDEHPLFTLVMHLAPAAPTGPAAGRALQPNRTPEIRPAWCRLRGEHPVLPPDAVEALGAGRIASGLDVPVGAGEVLWAAGTARTAGRDLSLVHAELFSTGKTDIYSTLDRVLKRVPGETAFGNAAPASDRPPLSFQVVDAPDRDEPPDGLDAITEALARAAPDNRPPAADPDASAVPDLLSERSFFDRLFEDEAEAVRLFFALHPAARSLRTVACRFTSEWKRDPFGGGWFSDSGRERFLWWEAAARHIGALPADGRVWHYHPARLLALLAEPPVPVQKATPVQSAVSGIVNLSLNSGET